MNNMSQQQQVQLTSENLSHEQTTGQLEQSTSTVSETTSTASGTITTTTTTTITEANGETLTTTTSETTSQQEQSNVASNDTTQHVQVSSPSNEKKTHQIALMHHSYSNLSEVEIKHLNWNLTIDFDTKTLHGVAEYRLESHKSYSSKSTNFPEVLILDTNHLNIKKVTVNDIETSFTLASRHDIFGSALVIPLTVPKGNQHVDVHITYCTTNKSSGLQWLSPELTADKEHPYLFTQCQAIHARTVIPCPDTPACKFTYNATVKTPAWCTALMSAIPTDTHKKPTGNTFSFSQAVPIPSYLLAIVAGDLASEELGPRSRVWAEKSVVKRAAKEFEETESFLQAAEDITGQTYVWKRYDLVCLPPSFPYGGMENPCLTFVTPTLLAGDKSLVAVIAHEISHAWTGNLVTNHSWRDFWLNEGWTMWLERKIAAQLAEEKGQNGNQFYDLKAIVGLRALHESIAGYGSDHMFTRLVPDMDYVDPDDVFSSVPYEKGFNFLNYLKNVVGGHETFDVFARAYIAEFKFKTITSEQFRHFFENFFTTRLPKQKEIAKIEWNKWYHHPGSCPVKPNFDKTLSTKPQTFAHCVLTKKTNKMKELSAELKTWPPILWILLLDTLLLAKSKGEHELTSEQLQSMDEICEHYFSNSGNAEIRFRWYTLLLQTNDKTIVDQVVPFLQEQGRMKFVRPLFRDLANCMGKKYAQIVFLEDCKHIYHPIAAKMISKDLDLSEDARIVRKKHSAPEVPKVPVAPAVTKVHTDVIGWQQKLMTIVAGVGLTVVVAIVDKKLH